VQFVQQPHDVVRRQLDEHGRDFAVQIVVQLGLEPLHRRDQPLLLCSQFLLFDDAVGHRIGEHPQFVHLLLNDWILGFLVEPARSCHGLSPEEIRNAKCKMQTDAMPHVSLGLHFAF
jgi:hypothetical protein